MNNMINNLSMLSISLWASKHTLTARTILVTSHIMLTILAVTMGKFMSNLSITIHPAFLYSSILLFSLAFIGYPIKKRNIPFSKRYRKQKSFDAVPGRPNEQTTASSKKLKPENRKVEFSIFLNPPKIIPQPKKP
jgi:hypothetical protein